MSLKRVHPLYGSGRRTLVPASWAVAFGASGGRKKHGFGGQPSGHKNTQAGKSELEDGGSSGNDYDGDRGKERDPGGT